MPCSVAHVYQACERAVDIEAVRMPILMDYNQSEEFSLCVFVVPFVHSTKRCRKYQSHLYSSLNMRGGGGGPVM